MSGSKDTSFYFCLRFQYGLSQIARGLFSFLIFLFSQNCLPFVFASQSILSCVHKTFPIVICCYLLLHAYQIGRGTGKFSLYSFIHCMSLILTLHFILDNKTNGFCLFFLTLIYRTPSYFRLSLCMSGCQNADITENENSLYGLMCWVKRLVHFYCFSFLKNKLCVL